MGGGGQRLDTARFRVKRRPSKSQAVFEIVEISSFAVGTFDRSTRPSAPLKNGLGHRLPHGRGSVRSCKHARQVCVKTTINRSTVQQNHSVKAVNADDFHTRASAWFGATIARR